MKWGALATLLAMSDVAVFALGAHRLAALIMVMVVLGILVRVSWRALR